MRPLGLLICLSACTLDNPAFFVTETGGTAGSGAPATDPTRPTTDTSGTTVATTDAPVTSDATEGSSTTDVVGTTAQVSDTEVTGPPATSTTTTDDPGTTDPPPMTVSTSDPNETDTGPMMCAEFGDPLGPQIQLRSLPNLQSIATADCSGWEGTTFHGRLIADNTGFNVVPSQDCQPNDLPPGGLRFPVFLSKLPAAKGACVALRFAVHPDYPKCTIAGVTVWHNNKPVLLGSFGRAPFPADLPLEVAYEPLEGCVCPGCCGDDAPDPDAYVFHPAMASAAEGSTVEFVWENKSWMFTNLRSHVHPQACVDDVLLRPDWLHFDWIAAQIP